MLSALLALAAIQGLAALTWFWSLKRHDMSVADIFWPLYHVVAAIIFFTVSGQDDLFAAAVLGLIIIWGLRLALHIGARQMGKGEDHRYTAARRTKDDRFPPHQPLHNLYASSADGLGGEFGATPDT
jgi:steroid 5-alpha reductase family enzyme